MKSILGKTFLVPTYNMS